MSAGIGISTLPALRKILNLLPFQRQPLHLNFQEEYTMLNGHTFPAGTGLHILLRHMAMQEKNFTRANEFIPERCAQPDLV